MKTADSRTTFLVIATLFSSLLLIGSIGPVYGQVAADDYTRAGTVWKLKEGYPQPNELLDSRIKKGEIQFSPGQLVEWTNINRIECRYTFTPPPPSLTVGQIYKASLQGVSSSQQIEGYYMPKLVTIGVSQHCTSQRAGDIDGGGSHYRFDKSRSVFVRPPRDAPDPEVPPQTAISDEITFTFQPNTWQGENRSYAFDIDAAGGGVYTYWYEPANLATDQSVWPVDYMGLRPPTGDSEPPPVVPPVVPPGRDLGTLLLQILAVLLGTGLAWLFPDLVQALIDILLGPADTTGRNPSQTDPPGTRSDSTRTSPTSGSDSQNNVSPGDDKKPALIAISLSGGITILGPHHLGPFGQEFDGGVSGDFAFKNTTGDEATVNVLLFLDGVCVGRNPADMQPTAGHKVYSFRPTLRIGQTVRVLASVRVSEHYGLGVQSREWTGIVTQTNSGSPQLSVARVAVSGLVANPSASGPSSGIWQVRVSATAFLINTTGTDSILTGKFYTNRHAPESRSLGTIPCVRNEVTLPPDVVDLRLGDTVSYIICIKPADSQSTPALAQHCARGDWTFSQANTLPPPPPVAPPVVPPVLPPIVPPIVPPVLPPVVPPTVATPPVTVPLPPQKPPEDNPQRGPCQDQMEGVQRAAAGLFGLETRLGDLQRQLTVLQTMRNNIGNAAIAGGITDVFFLLPAVSTGVGAGVGGAARVLAIDLAKRLLTRKLIEAAMKSFLKEAIKDIEKWHFDQKITWDNLWTKPLGAGVTQTGTISSLPDGVAKKYLESQLEYILMNPTKTLNAATGGIKYINFPGGDVPLSPAAAAGIAKLAGNVMTMTNSLYGLYESIKKSEEIHDQMLKIRDEIPMVASEIPFAESDLRVARHAYDACRNFNPGVAPLP